MTNGLQKLGNKALLQVRSARLEAESFDLLPAIEVLLSELVQQLQSPRPDRTRMFELCKGLGRLVTDSVSFMESSVAAEIAKLTEQVETEYQKHSR